MKKFFSICAAAALVFSGVVQNANAEVLQERTFTFTIEAPPEPEEAGYPDVVVSGLWKSRNPIQLPAGLTGIAIMDSPSVVTGPQIQTSRCSGTLSGTWPNQSCSAWTTWTTLNTTDATLRNSFSFDGTSVYRFRLTSLPIISEGQSRSYVLRQARSTTSSQIGSLTINRQGGLDDAPIVYAFSDVNIGANPEFLVRRELTSIALTSSATVATGPLIETSRCSGTVSGTWPNQTCSAWSAWTMLNTTDAALRNSFNLDGDGLYKVRLSSVPNLAPGVTASYVLKSSRTTSSAAVIGSVSYTGAGEQPDMTYVLNGLWNARNPVQLPAGLNGIALMSSETVLTGPLIETSRCSGTLSGTYPNQTCSAWASWTTLNTTDAALRNSFNFDGTSAYRIRLTSLPAIAEGQSVSYVIRENRATTGRILGSLTINRDGGSSDQPIVYAFSNVNTGDNPEFLVRRELTSIALTSGATVATGPQIQTSRCSGTVSGTWPNQTCSAWSTWTTLNTTDATLRNSFNLDGDGLYKVRLTTAPSLTPGVTVSYVLKSSRTTSSAAVIGSVSYTAP